MPHLEQGNIARVAESARQVSQSLLPLIEQGYDVIALVPSCALMLKFEWPLVLPKDEGVKRLAEATFDISEYIVDLAKKAGLAPGLKPLEGGVSLGAGGGEILGHSTSPFISANGAFVCEGSASSSCPCK